MAPLKCSSLESSIASKPLTPGSGRPTNPQCCGFTFLPAPSQLHPKPRAACTVTAPPQASGSLLLIGKLSLYYLDIKQIRIYWCSHQASKHPPQSSPTSHLHWHDSRPRLGRPIVARKLLHGAVLVMNDVDPVVLDRLFAMSYVLETSHELAVQHCAQAELIVPCGQARQAAGSTQHSQRCCSCDEPRP